jgi:hypothetical protein
MRVIAADLESFAELRDHKLATLPGVQRLNSTMVMKLIVDSVPVPIEPSIRPKRAVTQKSPARRR